MAPSVPDDLLRFGTSTLPWAAARRSLEAATALPMDSMTHSMALLISQKSSSKPLANILKGQVSTAPILEPIPG